MTVPPAKSPPGRRSTKNDVAPARPPPRPGPATDPDGISLVSLEAGQPDAVPLPGMVAAPLRPDRAAATSAGTDPRGAPGSGAGVSLDLEGGIEPASMLSLELDDHRVRAAAGPVLTAAARGPSAAPSPRPPARANPRLGAGRGSLAARPATSLDAPPGDDAIPGSVEAPIGTEASAAVAALLEGETDQVHDPTARIVLSPPATEPAAAKARAKTMTAALPAGNAPPRRGLGRLSRRQLALVAAGVVALLALVAGSLTDLPERLRGEPDPTRPGGVLRGVEPALAHDEYAAYAEGARRLEEAVASRHHAPRTRAAAAELLAQSIVLHGSDRASLARAKALLESATADLEDAPRHLARPLAWMALATGHARDAEALASSPEIRSGDRAILLGWVALDRGDSATAATRFDEAARAQPPAAPSTTATRFALARAREAAGSTEAAGAYRAVLTGAPAHLGAALGLARALPSLSVSARLELARSALAAHVNGGSRAELAAGFVFVAIESRRLAEAAPPPASAAPAGRTKVDPGAPSRGEADEAMRRARSFDAGNPAVAAWTGDALLWEGRYDEAIAQYRSALKLPLAMPPLPTLGFARAAALLESGRAAEAREALTGLARRLPNDARPSFWLGRVAERVPSPDLAAAERRYREALARDARFVPAALELARLLLDGHRSAEALDVLERVEAGGAPATATRLALGQAQLAAGNATGAAATFRQVLSATAASHADAGQLAAARLALATALEAQGDLDGAHAELLLLAARPGGAAPPGLAARMASVLARLGRPEEALAVYERDIAAGNASAGTRVAAARLALTTGRKDRSRALVTSVVEEDPRTPGALLLLAEISRADGDAVQAIADLRRALAVDGSPEVELEFGRALAALGRDEEALAALEQAQSIPAAGIERGRLRARRGDFEGAVKELDAALAKLPASAEGFLLLGIAEDRLGHGSRAEAAWRAAARLAPGLAEARYRLGRLEMERGQTAAALRELRAAGEKVPAEGSWRTDFYFQLGFAEKRQGSAARAQAAFRRYLELAPADAAARGEVSRELAGAQIR